MDIKEDIRFLSEIQAVEDTEWDLYFDPITFQEAHKDIKLEDFKFNEEEQHERIFLVTQLRSKFMLKG